MGGSIALFFPWKLSLIVYFVICYTFTRFKRKLFALIVSVNPSVPYFKMDYHTVLKQSYTLSWQFERMTTHKKTHSLQGSEITPRKKLYKSSLPFSSLIFQIFTHGCNCCPPQAHVVHGRLRMGLLPV